MSFADLPAVNATLNGFSAVLLALAFYYIKRGRISEHRNCMIAACISSTIFLACYVTYHTWMRKTHGTAHTTFLDPAWFRPIYLTILFTHLVTAIAIVPMIIITLSRALRRRFDQHKRIARWTWPLWMYVSVTGVLIYFLLYQIFPQTR